MGKWLLDLAHYKLHKVPPNSSYLLADVHYTSKLKYQVLPANIRTPSIGSYLLTHNSRAYPSLSWCRELCTMWDLKRHLDSLQVLVAQKIFSLFFEEKKYDSCWGWTFNLLPKLNNRRSSAFPPNLNRNVRTLALQALSGICIGQNPLRGQRAHKRDLYYSYLVSSSATKTLKIGNYHFYHYIGCF